MAKSARFWVWHNEGYVRIKLGRGETQTINSGGQHDEGYCYRQQTYKFTGKTVQATSTVQSKDCDGRMDSHNEYHCEIKRLEIIPVDDECIYTPDWVQGKSGQRDHSAEAMNY